MYTPTQICNLGLAKIASSRIVRLDPPVKALDQHCAEGYPQWKRSEIAKRRWVFATTTDYALPKVAELDREDGKNYKYSMPVTCLRPIRTKYTEWVQRGRFIYSEYDNLAIDMVENVAENMFDPLFVDVLACRVALECTEYVTQSNTKKADNNTLYQDAVREAAKNNAFTIGPEDVQADDNDFPFVTAGWY